MWLLTHYLLDFLGLMFSTTVADFFLKDMISVNIQFQVIGTTLRPIPH